MFSRRPVRELEFFVSLGDAKRAFDTHGAEADAPYVDVHGWHFTPCGFELAILELSALEVIDPQIDRSFPTEGCEFYVTLRRGRVGYATEQDLQARRLELLRRTFEEVRDQIDLLGGRLRRSVSGSSLTRPGSGRRWTLRTGSRAGA